MTNRKHPSPFNPLDKRHLGESVARQLLFKPLSPLPPSEPFIGAGVYAIYYSGPFPLYTSIAAANAGMDESRPGQPIYVGKAVPQGARKGGLGLDADPGTALHKRLAEHAKSVQEAQNLSLTDFQCRYLVVDDIWIPLGESLLIEMFNPLWNRVLDGFGNHAPGGGRSNQQRSPWDVVHPGRQWAEKLPPNKKSLADLETAILDFLAASMQPPPDTTPA